VLCVIVRRNFGGEAIHKPRKLAFDAANLALFLDETNGGV
jgi:hypothetical protein